MKRSPTFKLFVILGCLVVVFAIVQAFLTFSRPPGKPPTIAKETTYFTEPLRPDGTVDYAAAINRKLGEGVAPEENAFILLQRAFGPTDSTPPSLYAELQMSELPADGDYLTPLEGKWLRDHGVPVPEVKDVFDKYGLAMTMPWNREEAPHLAKWLDSSEASLNLLHEVSGRNHFFMPIAAPADQQGASDLLVAIPSVGGRLRSAGRILCCRAMLRTAEGDTEGAWRDLLACRRLGRLGARGPTMVDTLTGYATEGMSSEAILAFLEATQPSTEAIKRYQDDLAKLPPPHPVTASIDVMERCGFLDALLAVAAKRTSAGAVLGGNAGLSASASRNIDWDAALRRANSYYDQLVLAGRLPTHKERSDAAEKAAAELPDVESIGRISAWGDPKKNGESFADIFAGLLLPALRRVRSAEDAVIQDSRNLETLLALLAFKNEQGEYPEKLDELVPKFLSTAPVDVFTDGQLIYRRTEQGFVLYSVGPNMQDDRGAKEVRAPDGADDLAIPFDGEVDSLTDRFKALRAEDEQEQEEIDYFQ